jgi:tetratricopeptide (TPR) repeat protein
MAKIIQFSANPAPEKFGPQRARTKKENGDEKPKPGQLNLFTGAKIVRLNQLSTFEEALLLDERGDAKAARQQYLNAIENGESVADSFCNLGILEWQEGNVTKAVDYFTKSLKQEPRHYEAHYNLANLYAEVGNYNLAKVHYEVAIELQPEFPNSYFNLGLTLAMNKEYASATKYLSTYRHLTPGEDHKQTDDLLAKLSEMRR